MPSDDAITQAAEELYGVGLEDFTARRAALVKELRGSGHGPEATAVKALAKPSVAAWAVNQLVRAEPEWVQALVTAGKRLESAQEALLGGGDRAALKEATADQREAVDRLARLATTLLREARGSASDATIEQIRQTLTAASIDPEARAAVCAGRLTKDLAPGGFGVFAIDAPGFTPDTGRAPRGAKRVLSPHKPPRPARSSGGTTKPKPAAKPRPDPAAARRAIREARTAIKRAEAALGAARAKEDREHERLRTAQTAHDAAVATREQREGELQRAHTALESARSRP